MLKSIFILILAHNFSGLLASVKNEEVCISVETSFKSIENSFDAVEIKTITDQFQKDVAPLILNKNLVIQIDWNDSNIKASTTRDDDNNPVINVSMGILKHPMMTLDSIIALYCHELGHHLGGAPRSFRGQSTKRGWSSAEGQADYFAGSKCLKLIFSERCTQLSECARSTQAASKLINVFASIKGSDISASISKKDPSKVSTTYYGHPNLQCRLDTLIAALKCQEDWSIPFDQYNPTQGACLSEFTRRPGCWYAPQEEFR